MESWPRRRKFSCHWVRFVLSQELKLSRMNKGGDYFPDEHEVWSSIFLFPHKQGPEIPCIWQPTCFHIWHWHIYCITKDRLYTKSGTWKPYWNVSMVDIHLWKLQWVHCPGHARVKGNDRTDRLAGKVAITSGLCLQRSEVLRRLIQYLQAQGQVHHTTDCLEEIGMKEEVLDDLPRKD